MKLVCDVTLNIVMKLSYPAGTLKRMFNSQHEPFMLSFPSQEARQPRIVHGEFPLGQNARQLWIQNGLSECFPYLGVVYS